MHKGKLSEEKRKQKFELYKKPANVEISVPRVNSEIWDTMDHVTKSSDLGSQAIQKTLLKAVFAITAVSEVCLESKDVRQQVKTAMDAVGLILKANNDISMERRSRIVATRMNKKYRKLLSSEFPITEKLFGMT